MYGNLKQKKVQLEMRRENKNGDKQMVQPRLSAVNQSQPILDFFNLDQKN